MKMGNAFCVTHTRHPTSTPTKTEDILTHGNTQTKDISSIFGQYVVIPFFTKTRRQRTSLYSLSVFSSFNIYL